MKTKPEEISADEWGIYAGTQKIADWSEKLSASEKANYIEALNTAADNQEAYERGFRDGQGGTW